MSIEDILTRGDRTFYRIANADGKVWLLPASGLRTALQLYQPSGRKGKLLKRFFPFLHRLSPVRRAIHAETIKASLIPLPTPWTDNLEYSIFGGTPSVHQKITIQFSRSNRLLGYGKLTDSEEVASLFFHEQKLLAWLKNRGIKNIPECLECCQTESGMWYFLQSTIKTSDCYSPAEYTPLHTAFLKDMAKKTLQAISFEDSDFDRALTTLEGYLPTFPEEMGHVIREAIANVRSHFGGKEVSFSAYHADFTPWNMFVYSPKQKKETTGSPVSETADKGLDRGLYVFDWEYGQRSYPPMLDRYHFVIQQAIHVLHLGPDAILQNVQSYEWYDTMSLRCYLLDMISRWTAREKGQITPVVKQWTSMLKKL